MSESELKNNFQITLSAMKAKHLEAGPTDLVLRQDRLLRAIKLLKENYTEISLAMSEDFGHRSSYQSMLADIATTMKMLKHSYDNVATWMTPESFDSFETDMSAEIQYQPLGVVGVISPWNFPINLSFGPLAGIFAAGNTAMLKPSELTPKTSELLADLVAKYFDPMELSVVTGDAEVGRAFSALPFDHLVFTGSTTVGKHIMRAAAENLVPVTLELGGKSPVIIDSDFDIATAVTRTMTIKTFNSGQICISPDYMIIPQGSEDDVVTSAKAFISQSFCALQDNPDYTSVINDRHFARLVSLLDDAQEKGATVINLGPENEPAYDAKTRKIAPHLVLNVSEDMRVMQEEIFGPVLPVKTYQSSAEVIAYINANDRPLAAYLFSNNVKLQREFSLRTISGALVFNDVMSHASLDELPFGGVGASGIGAYHGIHGFRQFSHAKPVVFQDESGASNLRLRAPYTNNQAALEAFLNA